MLENLKSAAVVLVAACIVLLAMLFSHSKARRDGLTDAEASSATTPTATASDHSQRLDLVRELCARTGIQEPRLRNVLDDHGGEPAPRPSGAKPVAAHNSTLSGLSQTRGTPSANDVMEAMQFALKVAARDDDYRRVGVEYEQDDEPQEMELTLLDWVERDRAELCSKVIANAHDMMRENRLANQHDLLRTLIEDLSVRRDEALAGMRITTKVDISEIGTQRDRQLCDFYFAVAQSLRSRGYLNQLSASGIPGTTDDAIAFELPDVLEALEAEAPEVASLAPNDIHLLLEMRPREASEHLSARSRDRPKLSGPEA